MLSDRFPAARRGIAISAHISGGNIGTLVVPFIGYWVIGAVGWQGALAAFGIPALVVGVLILLLVHEDHSAYRAAALEAGPVLAQLGAVLRRSDIRWILLASLAAAGGRGLNIAAPFMLLYLEGPLGFDEATISLLYGLLLVGSVIGPLLAGWISDRFGRRRTLIAYYVLSALGIVLFVLAGSSLVLLVPLLLPFGTAVFSESPVLQAYLADRSAGPMRDVAFAVYFTVAFGVGALWGLIIGWIVEGPGYQPAFMVMAASFVVAGLLIAAVREDGSGAPA